MTASAELARALFDTASEVEAAEARIKCDILSAAQLGDCNRIIEIVSEWKDTPPVEVAARFLPSSRARGTGESGSDLAPPRIP